MPLGGRTGHKAGEVLDKQRRSAGYADRVADDPLLAATITGQSASAAAPARLDELDRRIVHALQLDGRTSIRTLADQLHVSRAGLYARLQRLHELQVITGYSAVVDPERFGYGLSAYVHVSISQHSWKTVRQQVIAIPEVWHAALVSGQDDLVLLVRTVDAAHLRDLVLNRLQTMPGVQSTHTVLVLDEVGSPATAGAWTGTSMP